MSPTVCGAYHDDPAVLRDIEEAARDAYLFAPPPGILAADAPRISYEPRRRSPMWKALREEFLLRNPSCAACGGQRALNVHHIEPFHLVPGLELSRSNLITLCTDGPGGMNCHCLVGHGGNWRDYIPGTMGLATVIRRLLETRTRG